MLCPYLCTFISHTRSSLFTRKKYLHSSMKRCEPVSLCYLSVFLVLLIPQNQSPQDCPLLTPASLWRLCVLEKPPFSPRPELLHTLTCHLLPGKLIVQLTPKWNLKDDFITVFSEKGFQRQWMWQQNYKKKYKRILKNILRLIFWNYPWKNEVKAQKNNSCLLWQQPVTVFQMKVFETWGMEIFRV